MLCPWGRKLNNERKIAKFFAAFFESLRKIDIGLLDEGLHVFFQILMSAIMVAMTVTRMPPV